MKTNIKLRLFISGRSETARHALDNLNAVCSDPDISERYDIDIDVIYINKEPRAAEEDKILVTPTLLKKLPVPVRRVVGDLSNREDIFVTLDITKPGDAATDTHSNMG